MSSSSAHTDSGGAPPDPSLAAAIGWERERQDRPAGLRTHILVGLSSALFVQLTAPLMDVHAGAATAGAIRSDPIRILEAVVGGIAFLGAGTIFVSRGGQRVHGLTTAASLLATAGVGVAVGVKRYLLAAGTTLVVVLVLWLLRLLEQAAAPASNGKRATASHAPEEQT